MARVVSLGTLGWLTLVMLVIGLSGATRTAMAQEKKEAAKEFRGRLPAYYGEIVDANQRAAIYKIQHEYQAKLAGLKAQLETLTNEQDEKIVAVLTPEQRKKVEELKAAAKARQNAKKSDAKAKTAATDENAAGP